MRTWRIGYGALMAVLILSALVIVGMDLHRYWTRVAEALAQTYGYALLIQLAIYAALSVLERVVPAAGPRKPPRGYVLNLQVILITIAAGTLFGGISGGLIAMIGSQFDLGFIDLRFAGGQGIVFLVPAFLLSTLIFDFFYYWFHRFEHENPFLWQVHKLHHMDEELCAVNRDNPFEGLFFGAVITVPLALLFKLDPLEGTILGYASTAWLVFIHTNIRLSLGKASVLFVAPQLHRIHHSRLAEHFDKNYAAFFPIWDVIFRTYHHPQRDEYPPTGVHDEREVSNVFEATLLPLRGWSKLYRAWRDRNVNRSILAPEKFEAVAVRIEAGKTYYWCACGKSKKQPFCDGSHRDTGITPLRYRATESGVKLFCICKRTKAPPFCDCAHVKT